MYVYVPNATATSAITMASVVAVENSLTFGVGVGVVTAGSVIPLLVGTKSACMATPLIVGVYLRVDEVKI